MSYTHPARPAPDAARRGRLLAWLAMCVASVAVAVVSFVVFGLFGGFMLIVGLNGFSEKQAQPVFLTYFLIVLVITTLAGTLLNWLIIRYGFRAAALRGWVAFVPAAAASVALLIVGPALAFALIPMVF
jgi:hypothetical protein